MGSFRDTRDSDHRQFGIAFAKLRKSCAKMRIVGGKKKGVGFRPALKILQMNFPDDFVRFLTQNLRQGTLQIL